MTMIVKGDQVILVKGYGTPQEKEMPFPDSWQFWHDATGTHEKPQHFFITPKSRLATNHTALARKAAGHQSGSKSNAYRSNPSESLSERVPNRRDIELFNTYYGSMITPRKNLVEKPSGRWTLWEQIDGIRYRRQGRHEGLYEHQFSRKVPVYSIGKQRACYLDLGSDFVADERGFVKP